MLRYEAFRVDRSYVLGNQPKFGVTLDISSRFTSSIPIMAEELDFFEFRVKFDSQEHRIDTTTYIQSLISMTTILKEFNYQIGDGEKISVNVAAEDQGSFDVAMVLVSTGLEMLSRDNVGHLASLVGLLTEAIKFKRLFKGADQTKTEFRDNSVFIKDNSGTVIQVVNQNTYNLCANPVVHNSLSDQFRSLQQDPDVKGLEFSYDGQSVRIERDDFADLAEPTEFLAPETESSEAPAVLTITKCVFEGETRKWEFVHNGMKISATIVDRDFWRKIDEGDRFGKGDKLTVDLRTIREFDPSLGAYVNREYQILNVRDHQPRRIITQSPLPNEEIASF